MVITIKGKKYNAQHIVSMDLNEGMLYVHLSTGELEKIDFEDDQEARQILNSFESVLGAVSAHTQM
ncbi:hypothetical protein BKE30_07205 [Alkanindiges hydrocarboniclasticus]|uniref:Uncharacterized protein n=2 Tax=Alkanindiges hydrocarboniclasticus TaxID=1907941 RepID=A0A1S8CUQ6_9GAMM|nr:hypothetical protein BKE30_07205 [Alkanindiges hydrocarboniclasticus]